MPKTMTEQICDHVVATTYDDLDDFTVERLKTRVLDGIGDIAIGLDAPLCDELFDMVKGYQEEGSGASVFFRNKKISAAEAAMVNSFEMRSYDFEPVQCENKGKKCSAGHISGTTIPAALAAAERANATGKEFITALALGDDVTARLGAASGFDVYGGWDNTGTINGLGATIIAGKLAKLTAFQLMYALGIDLNMLGGSMDGINDKTLAFKLPMALAARNALFSTDFAARGMTASHDAFGGGKGYFFLFCGENKKPELLCENLGEQYFADVVIKPWSSCRVTHPSIDAVMQIVNEHEIDPEHIAKIIVHTTPRTAQGFCAKPWELGDDPQVLAAFSIIYTAACAATFKDVRPEHMSIDVMNDSLLNRVIEKVEIEPSLPPDEYVTANVDIIMDDGAQYFARCENVRGNIYHNPMSRDAILDKFYKNVSGKLSQEQADTVVELIDNLENLDSIRTLTELLA